MREWLIQWYDDVPCPVVMVLPVLRWHCRCLDARTIFEHAYRYHRNADALKKDCGQRRINADLADLQCWQRKLPDYVMALYRDVAPWPLCLRWRRKPVEEIE